MVKVSVIVPVYNTESYLRRCLDSLVRQTLKDIEIIVIDDASTDGSLGIIKEYVNQYHNIKVISLEENIGVGMARNLAIDIASGEFIAFCDSDDYLDDGRLEYLYSYSQENDIIYGVRVIHGLDGVMRKAKNPYGHVIIKSIIRREFIKKYKIRFPDLKKGEDTVFTKKLLSHKPMIYYAPDNGVYYHYCKRIGSLSDYK